MSAHGIALAGRAGVGKTTLARAICHRVPGFRVASLATALKADLAQLGVAKGDPLFREVAVSYGSAKRAKNPAHWIERMADAEGGFEGLIVDDVRKTNEVFTLDAEGFLLVHLSADPLVRAKRLGVAPDDTALYGCGYEAEVDALGFDLYLDTSHRSTDVLVDLVVGELLAGAPRRL